jgi:lipoyl(octanoyl) transferase
MPSALNPAAGGEAVASPANASEPLLITDHGSRITIRQITIRRLGLVDYLPTWEAMRTFTATRTAATPDELWLLQHRPIYTYGVAGRREHLPAADNDIAVLKVDRGGQVTYHGPGQIVLYTLLDLRRRHMTVRALVESLEQAVLDLLSHHGVHARRRAGAPGVYVGDAKIAALGLRVSRGCSYHGLSLNVDGDLEPFRAIDPCGYPGLAVTRTRDLGVNAGIEILGEALVETVRQQLSTQA